MIKDPQNLIKELDRTFKLKFEDMYDMYKDLEIEISKLKIRVEELEADVKNLNMEVVLKI